MLLSYFYLSNRKLENGKTSKGFLKSENDLEKSR